MSKVIYDEGAVTITVEGLVDVANALGNLKNKTPAAAKVALNAAARQARRIMIAQARARYTVNAAGQRHLDDLRQRKRATNSNLSAELFISKMRNDLGYFETNPTERFTGRSVKRNAPDVVTARVLTSSPMKELSGGVKRDGRKYSKGFLVEFKSGHVGMVQRQIGSDSKRRITERGYRRWMNKDGQVEKLVTMGSPSAAGMHSTVWNLVKPDVVGYLQERLMAQVDRIVEREARKG